MLRPLTARIFRSLFVIALAALSMVFSIAQAQDAPAVTLEGYAILPADTFAEGPDSGAALEPTNGRTPPFKGQPVQGISAILPAENGNWYIMSDNGFGAKGNSADFILRFDEVNVNFDEGSVEVISFNQLSDPDKHIPFPIVNNDTEDRLLTGADFDIESFRMTSDGTIWFGDEFGPFLLHTDATGRVLEAPIATPFPDVFAPYTRGLEFVQSAQNPDFVDLVDDAARSAAANHPTSKGFEGMALNISGTMLYPLLEGAMIDDPLRSRLLIQEFDLASNSYTGNYWFYPMSETSNAIGDMTAINDHEFLVIERDGGEGEAAKFKRIYTIDLDSAAPDNVLRKTLLVDLMAITDVNHLTTAEDGVIGYGDVFQFPFTTIEAVYPIDENTLIVTNDNNYPFSSGRRPGVAPDDNEFIKLGLPEPLALAK